MKLSLSRALAFASATVLLVACTTNTTTTTTKGAPSDAPPIESSQVGGACTGVGTSPGDVAAFEQADCPAGLCIADARSQLATYCSADCSESACPDGYTCGDTLGGKKVCLKDGSGASTSNDAGADANKPGPIGTKTEKPVKSVNVPTVVNGFSCESVCKANGTECVSEPNGAGYENRRKTNGSTNGGRIYTCGFVPYENNNGTLTSATCNCGQPPIVTVQKSEGLHTCSEVCASWSMTCTSERLSTTYTSATSAGTPTSCEATPPATVHHYVCACK